MKIKTVKLFIVALVTCGMMLSSCGKTEETNYGENYISETQSDNKTAREENETESAARAERQDAIASAKARVQNDIKSSEMVMNGQVGELTVASTKRAGISIPTYIYFPAEYEAENTYPLIIMFAGFSTAHDSGTHFDQYAEAFAESGSFVVMYDNPGYGLSEEDNLAYTITNVKNDASDVLAYMINRFNIGKVAAFGYDVGGRAVMEMQVDGTFDFDQIELVAPYSETRDFIDSCFGDDNWEDLKAKAKKDGWVRYVNQQYSYQWFFDWEKHEKDMTELFVKAYKGKRCMLAYSLDDEQVRYSSMQKLSKGVGAASVEFSYGGHSIGFAGYDSPKDQTQKLFDQSLEFMKDLQNE